MKNLPNLTFETLNDLINGLQKYLPLEIRNKLINLFEKKFEGLKADEPEKWTPDIYQNQNAIIEYLLTQLTMDKEIDINYPFTFRNQYFITFSNSVNENSKRQMKHLIPFDNFIGSTKAKI